MVSHRNHTQADVPTPTLPLIHIPDKALETEEVTQMPSGQGRGQVAQGSAFSSTEPCMASMMGEFNYLSGLCIF